MMTRALVGLWCLLWLVGGCAAPQHLGGAGEVGGALRGIELFPAGTTSGAGVPAERPKQVYASDRGIDIGLLWEFPEPGSHKVAVALRAPTGAVHDERELATNAARAVWFTGHRFPLPQGEAARALAGTWQVEVSLDGAAVGRRAFAFDPGSIRLRTDARLLILQGTDDPEAAAGDWVWRDRLSALEHIKMAHDLLGKTLRDELTRRFPRVEGPRRDVGAADATIVLRTRLAISPHRDMASRLFVEVDHVPARTARRFQFQSSAGIDRASGSVNFGVTAADLGVQAGTSVELIQYLIATTQAIPE